MALTATSPHRQSRALSAACEDVRSTSLRCCAFVNSHAARVVAPVFDALGRYPDEGATLSEIQAAANSAAEALDGAEAPIRDCLRAFDADLEHARFALPESQHEAVVTRLRQQLEHVAGPR